MAKRLLKEPTLFVDIDGVLAIWNQLASLEEVASRNYCLNRDVDDKVVGMIKMFLSNQIGVDNDHIKVVSSAYSVRACWEKRKWLDIKAGLSKVEAIFVPYGEPKSDYVDSCNGILIDDYGRNLREWNGIGIKYYNGVPSKHHKDAKYEYSIDHNWSVEEMYRTVLDIIMENS